MIGNFMIANKIKVKDTCYINQSPPIYVDETSSYMY